MSCLDVMSRITHTQGVYQPRKKLLVFLLRKIAWFFIILDTMMVLFPCIIDSTTLRPFRDLERVFYCSRISPFGVPSMESWPYSFCGHSILVSFWTHWSLWFFYYGVLLETSIGMFTVFGVITCPSIGTMQICSRVLALQLERCKSVVESAPFNWSDTNL